MRSLWTDYTTDYTDYTSLARGSYQLDLVCTTYIIMGVE
jgi:hypothetical protein